MAQQHPPPKLKYQFRYQFKFLQHQSYYIYKDKIYDHDKEFILQLFAVNRTSNQFTVLFRDYERRSPDRHMRVLLRLLHQSNIPGRTSAILVQY